MEEKKIILILGIRGTGKSTKARELLKQRQKVIIYDTLNEYTEGIICEDKKTFLEVWRRMFHKNYCIVFRPINPLDDFDELCELVFDCGNVTFCIEEIDTFLSLNPAGLSRSFLNIVQRGRHRQIELIGITQRPYTMPAILRSQVKELYSFKQFENRDIEWLKGVFGDDAEQIKHLQNFEYLSFIDGTITKAKTKRTGEAVPKLQTQQRNELLQKGNKQNLQKTILPEMGKEIDEGKTSNSLSDDGAD